MWVSGNDFYHPLHPGYNISMSIKENLEKFLGNLETAAHSYRRSTSEISLMAVSKTRTIAEIVEARAAGLELFGENRVEEASEKFCGLNQDEYPLVLIGHLQSRKVSNLSKRFYAVHSVDSEKLAEKLSTRREQINEPLEILLQVNTSGEDSKSGFRSRSELAEAASRISRMPFLNLKGLMTMAPFVDDEKIVRKCFSICRDWSESIKESVGDTPVLSMGMSSDYRWAVAEGSTLLRIGTTLFGVRE